MNFQMFKLDLEKAEETQLEKDFMPPGRPSTVKNKYEHLK